METSVRRKLAELDVPVPFDVTTFCDGLARTHGFRITLVPVRHDVSQPCGLRAQLDGVHHIFHDRADTADRRDHAALHAISHLLLGHAAGPVITDALAARAMPDLDPAMVRQVLGHTTYTDAEEAEADLLANLIVAAGSPRSAAVAAGNATGGPGNAAAAGNGTVAPGQRRSAGSTVDGR
jgi:hypothetical protein